MRNLVFKLKGIKQVLGRPRKMLGVLTSRTGSVHRPSRDLVESALLL
jgi:hypothetical protein